MSRTILSILPAFALLALALLGPQSASEASAQTANAEEIMKRAHLNLYYMGNDGKAVVNMTITDKRGKERTRRFIMLRRDIEEGGEQKYYTYFLEPNDVRRTSFMVWKYTDKDDSRWIYVPAVDLVRRISAKDKGSSFVGSDFSYEDVSGRPWTADNHTWLRDEDSAGKSCYVIESVPKEEDTFAKKISWIGKENMVPLREEYYDAKGGLLRVFTAEKVEEIDGYPTVTVRRMTNEQKKGHTVVAFTDIDYDLGIDEKIFTERYLKNPPSDLLSE
jgi:outer membrane lipoprotein-sorting protein